MSDVWAEILGDISPQHLDLETVRYLEGRSPYYSTEDQLFIRSYFESKLLFPSVTSSSTRAQIQVRVCAIKTIIPSLRTFQEDTIWLEPCWKILRKLIPTKAKGTLQQELRKSYTRLKNRRLPVQTTESTISIRPGVDGSGFWFAYRQLILIAQRHFPCMTEIRPRKGRKRGEIKARYCELFQKTGSCWSRLARLALQLGFSNDSIKKLVERDSVLEMSADLLAEEASPQVTVNTKEQWRIESRCGRVFERAFHNDRKFIFLDYIYSDIETNPRQTITSFWVFRHIFHAFFGSSVPFAESFHSKSLREQSYSLDAPHYSPEILTLGSDESRTRPSLDQDIDMADSDDGEDVNNGSDGSSDDGEDVNGGSDGSDGSSGGGNDDGDNEGDDDYNDQVMISVQDTPNVPEGPDSGSDHGGDGGSDNGDHNGNVSMHDASSMPVVQQVKVGQGRSAEGGPAVIMSMHGLIESSASQRDKHSITFFPGGEGKGVTDVPISISGGNTTLLIEAGETVLGPPLTNEETNLYDPISISGGNTTLPIEAGETVLPPPLTDEETNLHDPTKHITTFPGAKCPQPPQSLNTDFQFPSGNPTDSHEASPSNRRKRKSPESPMVPVLSNLDDPLTLQTGIEQVPYLLEHLQTTESQVPHCFVYVSSTEPTEYDWQFSNQIHDSQYPESLLREMEKNGMFFTIGDLTRRQFSTISVEAAVSSSQAGAPIFIHRPTINFRSGFPSTLNESERNFNPEVPRWNMELHRWTLTSKKSKGSSSATGKLTEPTNLITPADFSPTGEEIQSSSSSEL